MSATKKSASKGIAQYARGMLGLAFFIAFLPPSEARAAPPQGWKLTFHDEFNAPTLDTRRWFTRYLGFREPIGRCEADYWLDPEQGVLVLRVKEGQLPSCLQTAQGDFHQAKYRYDHFEPHLIKFDQCYGYFEVRAKMNVGTGAATFWLNKSDPDYYNDRAVRSGAAARGPVLRNTTSREIDIFEVYKKSKYNFHILGAVAGDVKKRGDYGFDFSEDFHTYALDWRPGQIRLYVDGKLKEHTESPRVPDSPMFIYLAVYNMLNVSWMPEPRVEEEWPRHLIVDYIRVYQKPEWLPPQVTGGRIEGEHMRLMSTFVIEENKSASGGAQIRAGSGRGVAEFEFAGSDGNYDVSIAYQAAAGGTSSYRLWDINHADHEYRIRAAWEDTHHDGRIHHHVLRDAKLRRGTVLRLDGTCDVAGGALAAIDYVEIAPAASPTK